MQNFEQAPAIAEEIVRTFYNHDWQKVLSYYDKDTISWIGMGETAMAYTYHDLVHFYQKGAENTPDCMVSNIDFRLAAVGADYCLVVGRYHLRVVAPGQRFAECEPRVSYLFTCRGEELKVVHLHLSLPNHLTKSDDFFLPVTGSFSYEQMRQMLEEKTAQVEMIARTTAGGMKGSLDDEFYTFFYVNDELCAMLGYTYDEFMEMSGGTAVGAVYPPDLPAALASCETCFAKGPEYHAEYRIRKKDGSLLWVQDSGRKVVNSQGETIINSIITDISELKETISQLQIERERYEIVAELSDDIILEYDLQSDTLQKFLPATINGHKEKQIISHLNKNGNPADLGVHPDDIPAFEQLFHSLNAHFQQKDLNLEYRQLQDDGSYRWRRAVFKGVRSSEGNIVKIVGKLTDISSEKQLLAQSRTDALTGADNRGYMTESAEAYLRHKPNDLLAVCILMDVDHFKDINDTFGHLQGDGLLADLVAMLKSLYRSTDLIARFGGDEFMVLMKDIYSLDIVEEKAEKLLSMMCAYGREKEYPIKTSLSIGITASQNATFQQLYHEADIALYQAKNAGRDCFRIYQEGMEYPPAASCKCGGPKG